MSWAYDGFERQHEHHPRPDGSGRGRNVRVQRNEYQHQWQSANQRRDVQGRKPQLGFSELGQPFDRRAATLDLNGFSSTIYAYGNGFDGSGTITQLGGPAVLTLQGDQVVQAPFVGNITGGANVTIVKAGPNYSMELGGSASTFTGGIIVNSGVLQLDARAPPAALAIQLRSMPIR